MRSFFIAALALSALMAGSLTAQDPVEASVTYYGTPCTLQEHKPPVIYIHDNYPPVLGQWCAIMYSGRNQTTYHNSTQPVLITGLTKVDVALPNGPPIPGATLPDQPSDCRLYVSPDLIMFMPRDPISYQFETHVMLYVPNKPALAGFTFYCQWAGYTHAEKTGFVHAVTFSRRAEITVGVAPSTGS